MYFAKAKPGCRVPTQVMIGTPKAASELMIEVNHWDSVSAVMMLVLMSW